MVGRALPDLPRRFLIIRLSAMGDVLLTTPAVRMLKKRFPDSRIDFLVKARFAPLLQENPGLNRVLAFSGNGRPAEFFHLLRDIRRRKYDVVADLQGNVRSFLFSRLSGARIIVRPRLMRIKRFFLVRWHYDLYGDAPPVPLRYLRALKLFGVEDDGGGMDLKVPDLAQKRISGILRQHNMESHDNSLLVLAPGAGRRTKQWLPQRYAEVGTYFNKHGMQTIIAGGEGDADICRKVASMTAGKVLNMCGELSISETAALVSRAAVMIANDTGVMHMAAAMQVPLVALFGPTTGQLGFFPFRARAIVAESDIPCRPCSYHGTERCPKGHFDCMRKITSDTVIREAESIMKK